MKKIAPLQAKQAIVKSPKATPPAKPAPRDYSDFDDFINLTSELKGQYDAYCAIDLHLCNAVDQAERSSSARLRAALRHDHLFDLNDIKQRIAAFEAGRKFYDRDDFYDEITKRGRKVKRISRRVVGEQVGLLIGSFPNATPHTPKVYEGMLIEEIIAAAPSPIVLELVCRSIRREHKFPPTSAEVLKKLEDDGCWWEEIKGCEAIDYCNWDALAEMIGEKLAKLPAAIAAAEAREAEVAEKARLEEQRQREARERWERERKEREAHEQAERERRKREEAEERERRKREAGEQHIASRVRWMTRNAESRFLWRYFYLLMLSCGIVMAYEQLRELRLQHEKEEFDRDFAELDPTERKAWAQRGLAVLEGVVARTGAPLHPNLAALKREYEDEINGEAHKLNGSGSGRAHAPADVAPGRTASS
jgi:hypothetical protein